MAPTKTSRDLTGELAFLTRALKAPTVRDAAGRLAERARAEGWSHQEFLAACLQREVAAREAHGGEGRIRTARFPARKSLEEFDYDHARSFKRETIAHLGTLDFITGKENVVFLGPPGTGKTHLAIGLGVRACQAGHRVLFATAAEWVARLADAHHQGTLQAELVRLGRYPLLVVDEVSQNTSTRRGVERTSTWRPTSRHGTEYSAPSTEMWQSVATFGVAQTASSYGSAGSPSSTGCSLAWNTASGCAPPSGRQARRPATSSDQRTAACCIACRLGKSRPAKKLSRTYGMVELPRSGGHMNA
jgi:DNA replication protein DnaC